MKYHEHAVVLRGTKTRQKLSKVSTRKVLAGKARLREVSPNEPLKRSKETTKYRGDYFKYYRVERKLLKELSSGCRLYYGRRWENYYRKVYYCILPKLFNRLGWGPDRDLLREVEWFYFTLLFAARWGVGKNPSHRISYEVREKTLWARERDRKATENDGSQSEKALLSL
jgi:hypothetical protein